MVGAILWLPRQGDIPLEMVLQLGVASRLLGSEIPVVDQSYCCHRKKTAIGWIFKQLLGRTILGPTESKMWILPPGSGIQVHSQDVSPQYPRISQADLGSLDLPYRENVMEEMFGCWFAFPCEIGGLPCSHTVRWNCYWKTTSEQAFSSSVWLSAHRMLGKLGSFKEA